MGIKFSFNGTDVKAKAELNDIVNRIGPALVQKMTLLMTRLQQKARAGTEIHVVKESIRNPRAEIQGTTIIGHLDWGGELTTVQYKGGRKYDLALIFEYGSKQHPINPLGQAGQLGGRRQRQKGGLPKRLGANVLVWPVPYTKGDYSGHVFTRYAFPKGIVAEQYMRLAVDSMRQEFVEGLMDTIRGNVHRGVK